MGQPADPLKLHTLRRSFLLVQGGGAATEGRSSPLSLPSCLSNAASCGGKLGTPKAFPSASGLKEYSIYENIIYVTL